MPDNTQPTPSRVFDPHRTDPRVRPRSLKSDQGFVCSSVTVQLSDASIRHSSLSGTRSIAGANRGAELESGRSPSYISSSVAPIWSGTHLDKHVVSGDDLPVPDLVNCPSLRIFLVAPFRVPAEINPQAEVVIEYHRCAERRILDYYISD